MVTQCYIIITKLRGSKCRHIIKSYILVSHVEKKLVSAAEDVADKLGGDKAKTTSDLLQKALHYEVEAEKKDKQFLKIADQHKAKTKKKTERLTGSTDSTQPEIDLIEFMYVLHKLQIKLS